VAISTDPDRLAAAGNPVAALEASIHERLWSDQGLRDRWLRYAFFGSDDPPLPLSGSPHERRLLHRATRSNRLRLAHLLRLIAPRPGMRVLDVGCGVGGLVAQCRRAGAAAVGIDRSVATLGVGRQLGARGLAAGDGCRLPVADGCCDLVVSANLLEHVLDHGALLAECRRVVRPGGRIIIYTDNLAHVRLRVAARRLLTPSWQIGFSGAEGGHVALATPEAVRGVLHRFGCRTRVVYSLPAIPVLGRWCARFFAVIATAP
jgi:SAM-dependent methyltransferase